MTFVHLFRILCLLGFVSIASLSYGKLASKNDIIELETKLNEVQARLNQSINVLKTKVNRTEFAVKETEQRIENVYKRINDLRTEFQREIRKNSSELQSLQLKIDILENKKISTMQKEVANFDTQLKKSFQLLDEKIKIILEEIQKETKKRKMEEKGIPREGVHIVQPGDTLSVIAHKYGLKTSELIEINNIKDPDSVYIGQELTLVEE